MSIDNEPALVRRESVPAKPVKSSRVASRTGHSVSFLVLVAYFIAIMYPLFWMVVSAFKSTNDIFEHTFALPQHWLFSNFVTAWNIGISNYLLNSVMVTSITCAITVVVACFAAYGLSRFHIPGANLLLLAIAAGLMFSPQVSVVPLFKLVQDIGLYNTRWALIFPYVAYNLPLAVLLLRAHFLSLDKEYEESAYLDGCSSLGVLFRIIVPLSRPIVMTVIVLTAFMAWNEFLYSLTFITSDSLKTVPSGLVNFAGAHQVNWGVSLAGMAISALPVILLFIFTQKYFVRGLADGAVKG